MAFNFQEALNKPVESIERPPLAPVGHYICVINKVPVMREQGADWEVIDVPLQAVSATDDVDPDDLAAYGALNKMQLRKSFMFDKNDDVRSQQTLSQLRDFIEKHVKAEMGNSLKEALNNCVNQQVLVHVTHRADKNDPENQFLQAGRTAPVE